LVFTPSKKRATACDKWGYSEGSCVDLPYGTASTEGSGVPRGVWGVQTPPEIPKSLQNRAKLNPICENC